MLLNEPIKSTIVANSKSALCRLLQAVNNTTPEIEAKKMFSLRGGDNREIIHP